MFGQNRMKLDSRMKERYSEGPAIFVLVLTFSSMNGQQNNAPAVRLCPIRGIYLDCSGLRVGRWYCTLWRVPGESDATDESVSFVTTEDDSVLPPGLSGGGGGGAGQARSSMRARPPVPPLEVRGDDPELIQEYEPISPTALTAGTCPPASFVPSGRSDQILDPNHSQSTQAPPGWVRYQPVAPSQLEALLAHGSPISRGAPKTNPPQ